MASKRLSRFFCLLVVALTPFPASGGEELVDQTVLVYNEREPEGRSLADYYAQRRGVSPHRICPIQTRPAETVTRREFNEEIREPILRFLTRQGLLTQEPRVVGEKPLVQTIASRVSCLILFYGVPLRIENDPSLQNSAAASNAPPPFLRDEASVDSELATLPTQGLPLAGPLRNPFFGTRIGIPFTPPMNCRMLLVGRLDGPDAPTVRRMIDNALTAERYGLHGRAYFDARGIQDKGYHEGDIWIEKSAELFRKAGYECELDEREALFDDDFPMTDVAIYAGWYSGHLKGPFTRPDFRFRTGAVAYHIHSSSASSVRTQQAGWVGPMLSKGAAASMGSVFEPYLALTPHVDVFFERLLAGNTFVEAGWGADPSLSWQNVYVGDPLYRPFATSLDEQITRLSQDKRPELEWAWLRKVNRLPPDEAIKLCRARASELQSAVLYEKLGDLTAEPNAYQRALEHIADSQSQLRISLKLARVYERHNQPLLALAVYEGLYAARGWQKNTPEFLQKARDLAEAVGDTEKARRWQARIDERLKNR